MDTQRPSDSELSAWLDGELDTTPRTDVDTWLREHPDDAARLQLWAADRDALRARFDPVVDEPVPEVLRTAVREGGRFTAAGAAPSATTDTAHGSPDGMAHAGGGQAVGTPGAPSSGGLGGLWGGQPWRQAAVVAGLLLTGAAGGGALVWFNPPAQLALQARLQAQGGWAHRAAVAHVVYAPEVRHPVEVDVAHGSPAEQRAQEEHLSRWLGKRLDMPVRLFDLRPFGYTLVGGRLLPDAAGPSAQLMYQNSTGQRVTLYLRKPEPGAATAFSYRREGEVGMFYWVEDGFGCALVGKLPREQLLAMAEAVYGQSEAVAPLAPAPAKPPPS